MKYSELKLAVLIVKSKFLKLSDTKTQEEYLGFQSVSEDDLLIVLKQKWHEYNWMFVAITSVLGIILILKNILA